MQLNKKSLAGAVMYLWTKGYSLSKDNLHSFQAMMTQFAQLYPYGLIRYTQSSFLELTTDTEVHRIDFQGKIYSNLRRGTHGAVSFHHEHPLLEGVQGPATTLFARTTRYPLLSTPSLVFAIRQELRAQAGQWYDFTGASWAMWWHRFSWLNVDADLTRTGGIILQSVPVSVAQAVSNVCARHGVETYLYPSAEQISSAIALGVAELEYPYRLLLIGHSYVIAREFYVSTLIGNPSAKHAPLFLKKT